MENTFFVRIDGNRVAEVSREYFGVIDQKSYRITVIKGVVREILICDGYPIGWKINELEGFFLKVGKRLTKKMKKRLAENDSMESE